MAALYRPLFEAAASDPAPDPELDGICVWCDAAIHDVASQRVVHCRRCGALTSTTVHQVARATCIPSTRSPLPRADVLTTDRRTYFQMIAWTCVTWFGAGLATLFPEESAVILKLVALVFALAIVWLAVRTSQRLDRTRRARD